MFTVSIKKKNNENDSLPSERKAYLLVYSKVYEECPESSDSPRTPDGMLLRTPEMKVKVQSPERSLRL